ncbi:MAG: toll/interleukin-1 receptor domain-containing protein [Nitrosospira sp.]|nr:toll/interleukin-1 receptor domain-containing protein [Nitrosospira sp.]
MTAPKVFLSHASEDKGRFVVGFAQQLRASGVDVWLDQWEMKPGDSLVDRIFEEGLKDASAVLIVLSTISVQKPWVREELNASVVNRISRGTKLIPVVIDECGVPECLRSTVWQKIDNLNDYSQSLQRILAAIFDVSDKPAIGQPPARFSGTEPLISGLTRVDDLVLREIARLQIEKNNGLVMFDQICVEPKLADVPQQELLESLEILGQKYLIKISYVMGAPLSHVVLTNFGFQQFAEAYVPDYNEVVTRIAALLVNENICQNEELAYRIQRPVSFVDFVLSLMESNNHIKMSKYIGGQSQVWQISPSLKRTLQ